MVVQAKELGWGGRAEREMLWFEDGLLFWEAAEWGMSEERVKISVLILALAFSFMVPVNIFLWMICNFSSALYAEP